MIRKRFLFALALLYIPFMNTTGQDILMTIGERQITLDEFERIYNKNNNSISTDQQTPEEYLDLFINFKLKVMEAESLGMDTTERFLKEFKTYRDQLAEPYMTDIETREKMIREAYERMQWDVHISHILLQMNNQAPPEDTLEQYEKALDIRERIINGEDFAAVARATSDDPSVKRNGGDLGFFTAFRMVYPFETAAYDLEDGEISMPVRTQYGYHILKKHGKRPAVGEVKLAHIFLATPEGASEEQKEEARKLAMALGDSLEMGVDFGELAKRHSDDRNSGVNGGELPWRGAGQYFKAFEDEAFALEQPGDITEPFNSFYGWHIIKLLDKKAVGTFEEMKPSLEKRVGRGDRDRVKRKRYLDKLKENYEFELNEDAYRTLYEVVDSSVFKGTWKASEKVFGAGETLFTITGRTVTLGDFARHIEQQQRKRSAMHVQYFVDMTFNKYLEDLLLSIEKENLPEKFPEYAHILQEYHDGILLFELMDQKVWTKAVEDTTGLEQFFADHRSDYMWGERTRALEIICDSTVNVSKLHRKSHKIAKGRWDTDKLNRKFCDDTTGCIRVNELIVADGENEHVDALKGQPGTGELYEENGTTRFVIFMEELEPMPKRLNETRGQVTSDYQDHLEKEWIKELRQKYEINVNRELLSKI